MDKHRVTHTRHPKYITQRPAAVAPLLRMRFFYFTSHMFKNHLATIFNFRLFYDTHKNKPKPQLTPWPLPI